MASGKMVTDEQLHKNYIRLAKIIHPDLNPDDPDADQKFQELQEEYFKAQKLLADKSHYQASISITLKEAILGGERFFSTDDGDHKFVLTVPAGVKNKQTILYRGISMNSVKDAILHIKIFINLPSKFSIVGDQLILEEKVSFWKLKFGGLYTITGPDGRKIIVTIPKNTKNGKMFKVKDEGLMNRVEKKRHPLYIQFFGRII
jgi:DnaJ-class molecular chaperone